MLGYGVRTTIDLPDDLHKQAQAIARDTHCTLSETVADLIRRGLGELADHRHFDGPQDRIAAGERRDRRDLRGCAVVGG